MADFFDGLGKRISETVDEIGKKAGDTLEIQKYKNEIHTIKRSNERDYQDIGKLVYERFRKGDIVDMDFVCFCEDIDKRQDRMKECQGEIDRIKGVDK